MHRRLAGYFGAETETEAAVKALLLRHRAQRVALGMIAGSTTWATGHSRGKNSDDAHGFILAVGSSAIGRIQVLHRSSYCDA